MPPPWLYKESLEEILELETQHFQDTFSPAPIISPVKEVDAHGKVFTSSAPFVESCTVTAPTTALPYHWYEMAEMILDAAADDVLRADDIRQLLRDIREVRLAKMRQGVEGLEQMMEENQRHVLNGIGAMELSESRGFITGVMEGLRQVGASREQARREREDEERQNGQYADDDEDDDMT